MRRQRAPESSVVGSYVEGAEVAISAVEFNANGHFSGWTQSGTPSGSFGDPSAAETTFTMPADEVTLTANYVSHNLTHHEGQDPTCTEPGWAAYDECACGYTTYREIPAPGHTFENGFCTVCGDKDPNYVVTPPSRPTYPPKVDEVGGGSVKTSPSRPHAGDEVTVTPDPDEGKVVDGVTVADEDGKPVEVTDNGDGTWSFTQPAGSVTVTVTFACDGGELCLSAGFPDVDQTQWYHAAVDWAIETGAMGGYGDGTFGPLNPLTRAEMACVLSNLAGSPASPSAGLPGDCEDGSWYAGAVSWALGAGVMNGHGDGSFAPGGALTREEAACVLMNAAGLAGMDVRRPLRLRRRRRRVGLGQGGPLLGRGRGRDERRRDR